MRNFYLKHEAIWAQSHQGPGRAALKNLFTRTTAILLLSIPINLFGMQGEGQQQSNTNLLQPGPTPSQRD